MKKIKVIHTYILLFIIMMSLNTSRIFGQDIHFSQFYENGSLRNPALVGISSGDYKAGIIYRSQWSTLSVPYTTALVSYETKIMVNKDVQDYISFGVSGVNYKAGQVGLNTTSVYGVVNYNKSLEDGSRSYLSFGFTGGYFQRSFDISKMTFSNQYAGGAFRADNPSNENFNTNTSVGYDIGAGVSLNGAINGLKNSNYYIGAAAYNIARPSDSYLLNTQYLHTALRWTGNLGFRTDVNQLFAIVVHANYQNQGPYQETIVGALLRIKNKIDIDKNTLALSIGCFYRFNDAAIPTLKLEYQNWALNFSYDYAKPGRFGNVNFSSYELSLFVRGFYKHKRKYNQFKCPMFEEMMVSKAN